MAYRGDPAVLSGGRAANTSGAGGAAAGSGTRAAPVRLLDQVRARCRVKHYSLRTERVYVDWAKRFILANNKQHPRSLGAMQVEAFLSRLATQRNVAASSQNQALSALLFLYRDVLGIQLPWMDSVVRAKKPQRIPVVLSREEVMRLLVQLEGPCG